MVSSAFRLPATLSLSLHCLCTLLRTSASQLCALPAQARRSQVQRLLATPRLLGTRWLLPCKNGSIAQRLCPLISRQRFRLL